MLWLHLLVTTSLSCQTVEEYYEASCCDPVSAASDLCLCPESEANRTVKFFLPNDVFQNAAREEDAMVVTLKESYFFTGTGNGTASRADGTKVKLSCTCQVYAQYGATYACRPTIAWNAGGISVDCEPGNCETCSGTLVVKGVAGGGGGGGGDEVVVEELFVGKRAQSPKWTASLESSEFRPATMDDWEDLEFATREVLQSSEWTAYLDLVHAVAPDDDMLYSPFVISGAKAMVPIPESLVGGGIVWMPVWHRGDGSPGFKCKGCFGKCRLYVQSGNSVTCESDNACNVNSGRGCRINASS